ncbi:MAG: hypothetical protein IPJ36_12610 [Simplicispira sp.]|nr:hypothetical protein [Simplicispira sp.]
MAASGDIGGDVFDGAPVHPGSAERQYCFGSAGVKAVAGAADEQGGFKHCSSGD